MIYTQKKCILLYRIQRHLRITMKNKPIRIATPVGISKKNKINNDN